VKPQAAVLDEDDSCGTAKGIAGQDVSRPDLSAELARRGSGIVMCVNARPKPLSVIGQWLSDRQLISVGIRT
jgi:hypothetical protein